MLWKFMAARRRISFPLGLVLAGVLSFGVASGSLGGGMRALFNLAALLGARSPGERPTGALTQTKPPRVGPLAIQRVAPSERVKPMLRTRPATIPGDDVGSLGGPLSGASPDETPLALGGAPVVEEGGLPGFIPPTPGAPVSIFPASPGLTGDSGTVTPTPQPSPTAPASAVPEPATWMTMLLGLGLVGATLRRRGRRESSRQGTRRHRHSSLARVRRG